MSEKKHTELPWYNQGGTVMTDRPTIVSDLGKFTDAQATPLLRYVMLSGEKVLQQAFHIINYESGFPVSGELAWKDVPLEEITNG